MHSVIAGGALRSVREPSPDCPAPFCKTPVLVSDGAGHAYFPFVGVVVAFQPLAGVAHGMPVIEPIPDRVSPFTPATDFPLRCVSGPWPAP